MSYLANIKDVVQLDISEIITKLQKEFTSVDGWDFDIVEVSAVKPSCLHVYQERLKYSFESLLLCQKYSIPIGAPYQIFYSNGKNHIVVPPIVERRNDVLVVCDGMHRLYILRKQNIKQSYALIANNPHLPMPGDINEWESVTLEMQQLPVENNFINFNRNGLTGYSKYCNGRSFWTN